MNGIAIFEGTSVWIVMSFSCYFYKYKKIVDNIVFALQRRLKTDFK